MCVYAWAVGNPSSHDRLGRESGVVKERFARNGLARLLRVLATGMGNRREKLVCRLDEAVQRSSLRGSQ